MLVKLTDLKLIRDFEDQCFRTQQYNQNTLLSLLVQNECYGFLHPTTNEIVGYLIVQKSGEDYEINRIGVLPAYQNQKLATSHLQLWLKSVKAQHCFLEVETTNLSAIKIYQNCGFTIIRTRAHYYRNGHDAYVMQLNCAS